MIPEWVNKWIERLDDEQLDERCSETTKFDVGDIPRVPSEDYTDDATFDVGDI